MLRELESSPRGRRRLAVWLAISVGCSVLINGAPIGVRRIDRPIADGVFNMFVEIPDEGLPELAQNLRGTSIEIQKKLHG